MRKLRIVLKENKNSLLNEVSYFRGQSFRIHQQLLDTLRTKDVEKLRSIEQETDFKNGFPNGANLQNYTNFAGLINELDTQIHALDPDSDLGDKPFTSQLIKTSSQGSLFFKSLEGGDTGDNSIISGLQQFYRATILPYLMDETQYSNAIGTINRLYFGSLVNVIKTVREQQKRFMAGQGSSRVVKFFTGPGSEQRKELVGLMVSAITTFIRNVVEFKIESDNLSRKTIQNLSAAPAGGDETVTPPERAGGEGGAGEPPTTGTPPTTPPEGAGGAEGERPPAGTPIPVSTDLFRALSRSVPRWATAEIIRTLRSELGAAGYPLRESIKSSDSTLDILLKEEMSLLLEATRRDYMRELERAKTSAELDDIVARVNKEDKSIRNNKAIQDRIELRRQKLEKTTSASAPSAEPESSASPTDSKPDTESTPEAKDYFKELVVDKAPEKEAELDKMITQQKGMKEILRDYTLWLLKRKREAEDATKQKVGTPEFEKEAPKFFEKYSRMVTATRKLVQLFEDAESDREITDKRAVKMHVEAAFPKSAGFSNNIRELIETMLGERAGSAKDTRRDFQKAPSKGLVKDAGKAGKQVDLKKFQGFISSLRPPEGQKPLANKDAAVNIVRKFLSNYGIKLTESQTIRMINNLISESRYQTRVIKEYREHIQSQLIPYMQKQIGFNKPPVINFLDDTQNASDPFGKTAFYDPQSMEISVYTTGRHPKDIMRSVAHEVIHHAQNCRGQLDPQRMGEASEGYAQKNPYLRKLEEEAYLLGNMTFRDWEDGMKKNQLNEMHDCNKVHPNKSHAAYKRDDKAKEEKSLEEWKNEERWDLLMKRFKIVSEKRFANDPKLDKDGDGKPKWADEDDDNPEDSKKQVKGKK